MKFFTDLGAALEGAIVTPAAEDFEAAVRLVVGWARIAHDNRGKLIFVGNGGSAAIASHMATDWLKNGGYRALCFNDGAQLTCIGNDLGYEQSFALPLERFAERRDLVFVISSSGRSPNIIAAVNAAQSKGATVVTLSGFDAANPLRAMGRLNFYVPWSDYGIVECAHLAIVHAILNEALKPC